jgi:two-component system, chemotaxis family, sensor histidine kinase and response regulator WspE
VSQSPADDALLELFRSEVARHATVLVDMLAQADFSPDNRVIMQRCAHEMWGGARLVQLETVALLAKAMKDRLGAELDEGLRLSLELAAEWLLHLGTQSPSSLSAHVAADRARLESLYQTVSGTDLDQAISQVSGQSQNAMAALKAPITLNETASVLEETPINLKETARNSEEEPINLKEKEEAPVNLKETARNLDEAPVNLKEKEKIDPALMDLFLSEVQTHTDVLNEGLLKLESMPQAREPLEALMRSAHSIKGGARVVGLEIAVKLAHLMEDCFVAAQRNQLQLGAEQIDILLKAVDALSSLGKALGTHNQAALVAAHSQANQLLETLLALQNGESVVAPPPIPPTTAAVVPATVASSPEVKPTVVTASEAEHSHTPETDRTVRVTAHKIERLMGLAGEVTVSARWLPPFSDSLLSLKRAHMELTVILEKLQDQLNQHDIEPSRFKELQKARDKNKECTAYLADRLNQLDVFTSTFATHADRLYREVIGVRMRPFADGAKGFPRMVRDLARQLGKKVQFEIVGKSTEVDQDIQEKLDAPLNHLLRNAIDHGIESPRERRAAGKPETGTVRMEVSHRSGMLMISISDDGRGIEPAKLRDKILRKGLAGPDIVAHLSDNELMDFLFLPGFSTAAQITEISGRGVGLDVVHSMVHEVGGVVRAEAKPGQGMRFHLELPLTLSVIRTFLVEIAGEPYAFPLTRIDRCLRLHYQEIEVVEDRQYFRFSSNNIALVNIHDVLELNSSPPQSEEISVVVVSDRFNAYGLVVDKFIGEYDLVVRPLDARLGKVPDISAVAVMLDGSPVLIFDIEDLVHSIDKRMGARRLRKISESEHLEAQRSRRRILVVDDSITVREMERKLLEHRGYQVAVAVDGIDGWNAVRSEQFHLVVSDIDMPRMNGIELVKRIKQTDHLQHLPVIIVSYKDTEEHRLQGLEAGANYYLTKSSFEDESFINAVTDLIGEA